MEERPAGLFCRGAGAETGLSFLSRFWIAASVKSTTSRRLCWSSLSGVVSSSRDSGIASFRRSMLVITRACAPRMSMMVVRGASAVPAACGKGGARERAGGGA